MVVLVGGVGQLYQGDLDLGRLVVARLTGRALGRGVVVEDLHYGAIAVSQRLEDLKADALILVGAEERGRPPGTIERRRIRQVTVPPASAQAAVHDAGTGYVTIDLVVAVGAAFGALPDRTVTVEVEPASVQPSEHLSSAAGDALERAIEVVEREVRRTPLLLLADEIGALVGDGRLKEAPALETMRALLTELRHLDDHGTWGAAFALRDRLRATIAAGLTGEGMSHLDWGLWWTLIEELDRLQPVEATDV
ncbi:MAG: hypothetical protein ABR529_07205 [Actinomycetota bacterium]